MLLKTYRGPDLETALASARAEMGPDALVLGTAEKKSRLGMPVVEVTVGAPRGSTQDGPDDALPRLAEEVRELRQQLKPERKRPPAEAAGETAPAGAMAEAVAALMAAGLTSDLAHRFAGMSAGETGAGAVAAAAARGMQSLMSFARVPEERSCLFVIGPPGAGKTTTVAKLAARAAVAGKRSIFFAQADCERIGSFEQAEIYSRHIGATPALIDSTEDLLCVIEEAGDEGMVLVDTPGIGAEDHDRLETVSELRSLVPEAAVALLVPAGIHRAEAGRVLDRFEPLEPTCAALSKVDDGAMPGELVSALAPRELPLAFFTNGHHIPDSLQPASPHGLAALLLRDGCGRNRSPEMNA
jgi:flagellar biosynthesis protein FlhF